jgi:hypothetical protein
MLRDLCPCHEPARRPVSTIRLYQYPRPEQAEILHIIFIDEFVILIGNGGRRFSLGGGIGNGRGLGGTKLDFIGQLGSAFGGLNDILRHLVGPRDHRPKQFFGETAIALDLGEFVSLGLEIHQEVHAALVAADFKGQAALIPFLHAEDFRAGPLVNLQNVIVRALKIGDR